MAPDARDDKGDEMILLRATLVALHGYLKNSQGVDDAVSYLQSVGIERAEAEEVGAINFKGLQEGKRQQVALMFTCLSLAHFSAVPVCVICCAVTTAAAHFTSKRETGSVPAEWTAKMNSKWAKCVSRGRTVYVHLEDDTMTLAAPPEGVQYEEGVFSADFEPMCAHSSQSSLPFRLLICGCSSRCCWFVKFAVIQLGQR
jgi:hypothetical protein